MNPDKIHETTVLSSHPPAIPDFEEHIVLSHQSQAHTRTIVIAVDASAHARNAFDWAVENLLRKEDVTVLINVRDKEVDLTDIKMTDDVMYVLRMLEQKAKDSAHTLLRSYGTDLKMKGYNVVAYAIRGEPRTEIIRKAEQVHANMIVLGSRGMGAIKRVLLGSVSSYVLNHSHVPVLIVKDDNKDIKK